LHYADTPLQYLPVSPLFAAAISPDAFELSPSRFLRIFAIIALSRFRDISASFLAMLRMH